MKFEELLIRAKGGDEVALAVFMEKYKPMLIKAAILNDVFDEDLYQELCLVLIRCIDRFMI